MRVHHFDSRISAVWVMAIGTFNFGAVQGLIGIQDIVVRIGVGVGVDPVEDIGW